MFFVPHTLPGFPLGLRALFWSFRWSPQSSPVSSQLAVKWVEARSPCRPNNRKLYLEPFSLCFPLRKRNDFFFVRTSTPLCQYDVDVVSCCSTLYTSQMHIPPHSHPGSQCWHRPVWSLSGFLAAVLLAQSCESSYWDMGVIRISIREWTTSKTLNAIFTKNTHL